MRLDWESVQLEWEEVQLEWEDVQLEWERVQLEWERERGRMSYKSSEIDPSKSSQPSTP